MVGNILFICMCENPSQSNMRPRRICGLQEFHSTVSNRSSSKPYEKKIKEKFSKAPTAIEKQLRYDSN